MADDRQAILQIVRMRGPVLPIDISKQINRDTLTSAAMLSEMVDNKVLRLSHTKVGGSPVYFLPGQESRLENLYRYLHDKEKKAFDHLKKNRVLRDKGLAPVVRIALRSIKDFAVPLEVNFGNGTEVFWKWYLLPTSEAEPVIKKLLGIKEEKPVEKKPEIKKEPEVKKEPVKVEPKPQPVKPVDKSKEDDKKRSFLLPEAKRPQEEKPIEKKIEKPIEKKIEEKPIERIKKEIEKPIEEKKPITEELERIPVLIDTGDPFVKKVVDYFRRNRIEILDQNLIKKKSEVDFVVRVPSAVGSLEYYCKAKTKKRYNEGDLSNSFVQGQLRKLPVLLLVTGDFTKKAKEMMKKEFKNINVKKI